MTALDISADIVDLTAALVDVESVSGNEAALCDELERQLGALGHLSLWRHENTLVARTDLGRDERVVIAGHLDTVPINANLPSRRDAESVHGLGACDMKGGVAVGLRLAHDIVDPVRDVTYVFYECEEVEATRNGLGIVSRVNPDALAGDFAVLMEPSNAGVEAGCQGTLRAEVTTRGTRAHSARGWKGDNAIHAAGEILERLRAYEPRRPVVDGLTFHEGMNAVFVSGGVAGNVIPDECTVTVNFRFAPDLTLAEARTHVHDVFAGFEVNIVDEAPAAQPGLDRPAAAAFVAAVGGGVAPKFGWTDVARFSQLGVPAVNYGPGNPELAHTQGEYVPMDDLHTCLDNMTAWLTGRSGQGA